MDGLVDEKALCGDVCGFPFTKRLDFVRIWYWINRIRVSRIDLGLSCA